MADVAYQEAGALVRAYYRTIDAGDYDALADLLTPDFVQVRSDRTIEGQSTFVRFMREERPATDTTHEVDAIYRPYPLDGTDGPTAVAVRGRLRRADGTVGMGFVDVFSIEGARIERLVTYANRRVA